MRPASPRVDRRRRVYGRPGNAAEAMPATAASINSGAAALTVSACLERVSPVRSAVARVNVWCGCCTNVRGTRGAMKRGVGAPRLDVRRRMDGFGRDASRVEADRKSSGRVLQARRSNDHKLRQWVRRR
ncbi:hypothetical protein BMAPRL20_0895 [Burkholderia mallei PRL-20]|nr:hypothetical protein BMAPRL20_0895 [Burkholderia mallei PRL-20]